MSIDIENNAAPPDPDLTLTARRTISIQASATGQPSARLPVEFRTMSVQIESGTVQPTNNVKYAAKGT